MHTMYFNHIYFLTLPPNSSQITLIPATPLNSCLFLKRIHQAHIVLGVGPSTEV